MKNPLVSVIIPAYNSEEFIENALQSILSQSYFPLEIIVVDDGSSDNTSRICRRYREVIYHYQDNAGPASARNVGINTSNGKYIAFLDSDDCWTNGKLHRQVELMEAYPDVGLLSGDMCRFSEGRIRIHSMFENSGFDRNFFGHDFYVIDAYRKILTIGNYIPTGTVIVRKKCLEKVGGFDESLRHSEDVDLWLRIAMEYPLAYCKDQWMLRRDHGTNLTNNSQEMYLAFVDVIQKQEEVFRDEMRKMGIDISKCYRNTYFSIGYLLFSSKELFKAREYFFRSLLYGFQSRALFYLMITYLSSEIIDMARRIKGTLSRFLSK